MANKYTKNDLVSIDDGLVKIEILSSDGSRYKLDVPDGTQGKIFDVISGGFFYTVELTLDDGEANSISGVALFFESDLLPAVQI